VFIQKACSTLSATVWSYRVMMDHTDTMALAQGSKFFFTSFETYCRQSCPHAMPLTAEDVWLQKFALLFSPYYAVYVPMKCLCRATGMPALPNDNETLSNTRLCAARLFMMWLEDPATIEKMATASIKGNCAVISFPHTAVTPTTTGMPTQPARHVWHGTSLLSAWSIWHHGFVIGHYGHSKNNRHVNGIWCMPTFNDCMNRAATSKSYQALCSQCQEGQFNAWSTPVGIQFSADEVTTISGTAAVCLEMLDGVSLNRAGYCAAVQDRIHSVSINFASFNLYRDNLGDELIRDQIANGDLIMCSAKWCYSTMTREELASALVCKNLNPCGKVIAPSLAQKHWHRSNGKRYFCPECWSSR
jgi:hypothetical protein